MSFRTPTRCRRRVFARSSQGAERGWLYLIGDPKQAIFGFRGADVFTYLAAAERADRAWTLETNHRSERALVEAVNAVFARAPKVFAIEHIDFHPALAAGRQDAEPLTVAGRRVPPLRIAWWEEDEPVKAAHAEELLPGITAAQIARSLAGGVTIGGRAVEPRDFAVLVGTHAQARSVHAELGLLGIPAVLHSNGDVFAAPEATELQAILAAIAEPARDPLIRAALATAALGADAAALEELGRDEQRWEATLLRFHGYHQTWQQQGFVQMFRQLLQGEHVRPRLLALPDGERRLTNLLHLTDLLHQACCEQRRSMASLVRWLAEQRAPETVSSEEREQRLERDDRRGANRHDAQEQGAPIQHRLLPVPLETGGPPQGGERGLSRAGWSARARFGQRRICRAQASL